MKVFLNKLLNFSKQYKLELLSGLAALIILEIASVIFEKSNIESDLMGRSFEVLHQRGFNRIEVSINGRDLILNGEVSSETAQKFALQFAHNVYGVRTVNSALRIKPLRLPHLKLSRSLDNVLIVEGEVPTQNQVNQFIAFAESTFDHDRMVNLIRADPEVTDPDWEETVKSIAGEGNQLNGMEIEIGAGTLSIGGLIETQSNYNTLLQRVQYFAEIQQLEFVDKIGITPGQDFSLVSQIDGIKEESDSGQTDENSDVSSRLNSGVEVVSKDIVTNSETETDFLKDSQISPGECQTQINSLLSLNSIEFSANSTNLSVDNYTIIKKLASILQTCPTLSLNITGHTDSTGKIDTNLRLSQARADAVRSGFLELGIEFGRMEAKGYGSARPMASNETESGRQKNRRIEIILSSN